MKILILLWLEILRGDKWVDLEDGEPMTINLKSEGKQFLNFNVDGESFTVDLMSKSAVENKDSIPDDVS